MMPRNTGLINAGFTSMTHWYSGICDFSHNQWWTSKIRENAATNIARDSQTLSSVFFALGNRNSSARLQGPNTTRLISRACVQE